MSTQTSTQASTQASTTLPPATEALIVELDREFAVVLRRIRRLVAARAEQVHPQLQIGAYLVLAYIGATTDTRSAAVAEELGMDKGTVSRHVQHLVELGLVGRRPDPGDGRAALLDLTPVARERLAVISEQRKRGLTAMVGHWSDQELSDFVRMLAKYNQTLTDR